MCKSTKWTKRKPLLVVSSAVLAAMAGIPLTAYAGTHPSVTLSVYVGYDANNPQAQANLYNKILIPEFEKENPGVKVTWSYYSSSTQENTELQTAIATHQGPNIFELGTTFIPTAYATKEFHVLSNADWKVIGGKDKFFGPQLTMSGPNSSHYIGVPEMMLPFAMVYNTKLLKAAGISKPPVTWTQFVIDAKKMTNPKKGQWGTVIDPEDSYDPWKIVWAYSKQLGSDFLSPNLKTATLDSPQVVNAMTFWFDWLTKYKIVSSNDLTYKNTDALQQFENGHIGMWVFQGPSLIPSLNQSAVKGDYAFAPLPTIPYGLKSRPKGGTPTQTIVSGQDLAIPSYTTGSTYQAALKWVKFITDPKQQQELFSVYGDLPVTKQAYKGDASLNTPMIKAFVQSEEHASPTPFSGDWGNLETIFAGVTNKLADELATNTFQPKDIANELKSANAQVQQSLQ
ncbi:sugar ABC transporter substrate-binding protein [Alicyclobacillus hesperidum subsp. aegles]|nr:sugar ABC transporter substrate-binding protein [Alicyclobacillus hesperidum subsp. aegles]